MIGFYQDVIRPFLFQYDPEWTHSLAVRGASLFGRISAVRAGIEAAYRFEDPALGIDLCGIGMANPVGLAAGYDKSGTAIDCLAAFGFGHVEIGSVSIDPSDGNPRPRLFRLPTDRAVVVHYGLQNDGADPVRGRLRERRTHAPVGTNIVKTNRGIDAPSESADTIIDEYRRAVVALHDVSDYLTLNLSCPNTEDGRDFFVDPANTRRLVGALVDTRIKVPLFLKISPLGGDAALDALLEAVDGADFVSGFIFNLPPGIQECVVDDVTGLSGALTGKPVAAQVSNCIRRLYTRMDRDRYCIIGAGGISTAEDAYEKIRLGASAVQLLTALVYEGPGVVRRINHGLCDLMRRDGVRSIGDVVGVDAES